MGSTFALGAPYQFTKSCVTAQQSMAHNLNVSQMTTLASAASEHGYLPVTLRMLSELRWLEYLGLMSADPSGRYVLTEAGRYQLGIAEHDGRRASG